jgi:hypothetical protein
VERDRNADGYRRLASPAAAYMTETVVDVNGGFYMG